MNNTERISRLEQQMRGLLITLETYAGAGYPPFSMFTKFPSKVSLPEREVILLNSIRKIIEEMEKS